MKRKLFKVMTMLLGLVIPSAGAEAPQSQPDPAKMGIELRKMMLSTSANDVGITKTDEFPNVWGVVMDWPIGKETASVVALCDGNCSVYTTKAFGVVGGVGHEKVRLAASKFVKAANDYSEEAKPVSVFPYPAENGVTFYLLTFSGVRMIDCDWLAIKKGEDKHANLFGLGQEALTELRISTEK